MRFSLSLQEKLDDMARSMTEIEAEIVEEFSMFDEWMDKYEYIIEMGQNLEGLDDIHKTEENIVHGCQSRVWLHARKAGDAVIYEADSDAIITKGLIAMLIRVLSGQSSQEIMKTELSFIDKIGMREHLSPTRSNGLNSMIKQMKHYALAFSV